MRRKRAYGRRIRSNERRKGRRIIKKGISKKSCPK
jgi:hypothetical protein